MHHNTMNLIAPEFIKVIGGMKGYFDKAASHADHKKYDVNNLLTARLAPDQYDLAKQVHSACFLAEDCFGRLAGKEPPKTAEPAHTIAAVKSRIDSCVAYLQSLKAEEFQGWEERPIDIFFLPGKYLPGTQFLSELGIPNIYFHIVTVYAILRHNGVEVGKGDYLAGLNPLVKKA